MTERELVKLYLMRDEAAIRESEAAYGAYCQTIARRILHDEGEAAECVNDAWFQAWQTIPPAEPEHLGAYLAKITRNLALSRYRKAHSQKRGADRVELCLDELSECLPDGDTPENAAERELLAKTVNDFIAGLPGDERVMFVRRYFYLDSVSEVANRMGCSQAKVKTAMFRCRKKLQEWLKKEEII